MLWGLLLVFLTGVSWVGIGIVVSLCASRGVPYNLVQGIAGAGGLLLGLLIFLLEPSAGLSVRVMLFVLLTQCLAGICDFIAFSLTAKAMSLGPNGLVWAVMQSGLIGSFLMGVLFFGEEATVLRLTGLSLIVAGVLCMGIGKDRTSSPASPERGRGKLWLVPALGAFLLVALTHCMSVLPSFLPEAKGASSAFRATGTTLGSLFTFSVFILPGLVRKRVPVTKAVLIFSFVILSICSISRFLLIYNGVDMLAKAGAGSLGFPVAIGVCVVGFALYSLLVRKERFSPLSGTGLVFVMIGVVAISL